MITSSLRQNDVVIIASCARWVVIIGVRVWDLQNFMLCSNIALNILPSDSFISCLHSLLEYSTGELQALQLIVLAAFGVVD